MHVKELILKTKNWSKVKIMQGHFDDLKAQNLLKVNVGDGNWNIRSELAFEVGYWVKSD